MTSDEMYSGQRFAILPCFFVMFSTVIYFGHSPPLPPKKDYVAKIKDIINPEGFKDFIIDSKVMVNCQLHCIGKNGATPSNLNTMASTNIIFPGI